MRDEGCRRHFRMDRLGGSLSARPACRRRTPTSSPRRASSSSGWRPPAAAEVHGACPLPRARRGGIASRRFAAPVL